MILNVKYYGLLAELTGCNEEAVEVPGPLTQDLLKLLYAKYPALEQKDFQISQNLEIIAFTDKLTNAEVALLPPFSGG